MSNHPVDLRSDTVTKPSPAMREAMMNAEVGDDVLGDDPTVIDLQEHMSDFLGMESSLYVPTGVMANQTAIRAHTESGDQVLTHEESHINKYESGAPAALSGCMLSYLHGPRGLFQADDLEGKVNPPNPHFPITKLLVLENTHNRGGGSIWPVNQFQQVTEKARSYNLKIHLDGARLMNACVALGISPKEYTKNCDSVSMCFSKGLGAPVGSVIAGKKDFITRVHRFRKMFGGGMRQVGIIAAGALYAIKHNVERLADDHKNAKKLALAVNEMKGFTINPDEVETNLIFFMVDESIGTAQDICDQLHKENIWMLAESKQRVRAVTHLDVDESGIDRAIDVLKKIAS